MTSLIQLKSNCSKAVEQCIADCYNLIESTKDLTELTKCKELAQLCIIAGTECLDACESARLDRGKMMLACAETCKRLLSECEKYKLEECRRCAVSCKTCLQEFEYVLA